MAFKKKTYRKKNNLTKKVNKLIRLVKPEVKQKYQFTVSDDVQNTFKSVHISGIANGTLTDERIGDTIHLTRLRIRLLFRFTAGYSLNQQIVRVVVFKSNQQFPDIAPAGTTVLPNAVASFMNYNSSQYTANTGDYVQILYDKKIVLSRERNPAQYLDIDKKLNLKVQYNGNATTDIQKNGIYAFLVGDASSYYPTWEGLYLLDYTDM